MKKRILFIIPLLLICFNLTMIKPKAINPTDALISTPARVLTEACLNTIFAKIDYMHSPSWYDDFYYSINVYATTSIAIRVFPKEGETKMILGRNTQDSNLQDIDNWYLIFSDNTGSVAHRYVFNSSCVYSSTGTHTTLDTIVTNDVYYSNLPAYTYLSYVTGVSTHNTTLTSLIGADFGQKEPACSYMEARGYKSCQSEQLNTQLLDGLSSLERAFVETMIWLGESFGVVQPEDKQQLLATEFGQVMDDLFSFDNMTGMIGAFFSFIYDSIILIFTLLGFILEKLISLFQFILTDLIGNLFVKITSALGKVGSVINIMPTQIRSVINSVMAVIFSLLSFKIFLFVKKVVMIWSGGAT